MALTHLADTSVLTRLNTPMVRQTVRGLLADRRVGRCAMSDLELGFSARNAEEWDHIHRAITLFPELAVTPADVARARGIQRALADQGL